MSQVVAFKGSAIIDTGIVKNVSIVTSSLDMNLVNITSVKDPILPQDAATKHYVDSVSQGIAPPITVALSGINKTPISNYQIGSYIVTVTSSITDAPSAIFNVSKNFISNYSSYSRNATYGRNTFEQLDLIWAPNSGMMLFKTGVNYDGNYSVKIE
jgi:hypothetical protein